VECMVVYGGVHGAYAGVYGSGGIYGLAGMVVCMVVCMEVCMVVYGVSVVCMHTWCVWQLIYDVYGGLCMVVYIVLMVVL